MDRIRIVSKSSMMGGRYVSMAPRLPRSHSYSGVQPKSLGRSRSLPRQVIRLIWRYEQIRINSASSMRQIRINSDPQSSSIIAIFMIDDLWRNGLQPSWPWPLLMIAISISVIISTPSNCYWTQTLSRCRSVEIACTTPIKVKETASQAWRRGPSRRKMAASHVD